MLVRPTARTVLSLKRIALPSRAAIMISALPLVSLASNNWSPSRITIALTPLVRGREYASSAVFLIVPSLVHMTM